jgi:hypothetical protein
MKTLTLNYPDGRQPFWSKCVEDGFIWPAAFYPMEVSKIAVVLLSARCPLCGAKGAVIPKQDGGTLNEPPYIPTPEEDAAHAESPK